MAQPTYDQAAIDQALSADTDLTPTAETHACQTGCGRLADLVLVNLRDSSVDVMCSPCMIAMWLAIAEAIPQPPAVETVTPAGDAL